MAGDWVQGYLGFERWLVTPGRFLVVSPSSMKHGLGFSSKDDKAPRQIKASLKENVLIKYSSNCLAINWEKYWQQVLVCYVSFTERSNQLQLNHLWHMWHYTRAIVRCTWQTNRWICKGLNLETIENLKQQFQREWSVCTKLLFCNLKYASVKFPNRT